MNNEDLIGLEQQLQFSLHPVAPDPRFVSVLQHRLTETPAVTLERATQMRAFLVIGLGLFSGALLFWLLRRLWLWVGKS